MFSCIFYNLYAACATTAQGKSCNSAAALFFESFLNNNVPFGSMNELVTFIRDVVREERHYDDHMILDEPIGYDECFFKLMSSTGFGWIPTHDEMMIIWEMITQLPEQDINRLFYKNNLFHFVDNKYINDLILRFLSKLEQPYMDPNKIPEESKDELMEFYDLLYEFVYYKEQIIDRLDKMYYLIRSVNIVQDTDSVILSLDGWYRYISAKCIGTPMKIKELATDKVKLLDGDGNPMVEASYTVPDYDFINDEIIETDRLIDPLVIVPQDNLKYSIINLITYCISNMCNDYMARYAVNSNSETNGECMLSLKNEFFYSRLLVTEGKKHYAAHLLLQEGNNIPQDGDKDLDIKGMEVFVKSTMNETTRGKLKKILYEDILTTPDIDQLKVIKDLAIVEKEIYQSIQSGEKKFFKPVKIRSQGSYEDPMRIQGVKAACAYNALREEGTELFDLTARNSLDLVKVDMNPKNIDTIKEQFPNVYEKALALFRTPQYATGIDAIAIPLNESVPEWVKPFVRYSEIISDNVAGFPLESIGLFRGNDSNNSTNIIQF